ncbi:molecular chaperone HtpG [Aestuariispira insulae]|uniref:Chaperone protein HtpG n=1 Tax=Aestuariispira insulae TaxID=1461337 RepID=A0A3D9HPX8_9PROT|nr:molecular chaperone HtpG [Aestuariispira insulae]RED51532.1 molecular chaperone HtpG [Aestuariispira insulae]
MSDTQTKSSASTETMGFQAEVGRLLDIVAHSLYSEREIFLRELISNSADACDRLRYSAIASPDLTNGDVDFAIDITVDAASRTLTIADNGSGMGRDELIGNLGTIARSGSSAFVSELSGDSKKDVNLIGQFGVGFYSAFMVAEKVVVNSRKAGEEESWRWISSGQGSFDIEPGERETRGTAITLHMREDAGEFLEEDRLRHIVKTYSNHIPFPIRLTVAGEQKEGDDEAKLPEQEQLNDASALWTKPKSQVTEEQHKEFYHHVSHAFDDPWLTLHFKAEGMIEYGGLLYVPGSRPFDLFHPERVSKLKLYVKRVFISDECDDLIPSYLRFLRGVVDSEDLPLNVSREMLQNNPVLTKIRAGLTKRVLSELGTKAEKEPEEYAKFWENFGIVLKEGIYETTADRDQLLKLARFESTTQDGLVSLADYIARMKEGQEHIYYITGDSKEAAARSPQLEGFAAKGIEVLFMTDPVDEFWIPAVHEYEGKQLKSVTRGGADLGNIKAAPDAEDKKDEAKKEESADLEKLVAAVKEALGNAVADVRSSDRLTTSAVCLVADDNGMDMHLERLLQQHKQLQQASPRILELNPSHALVTALAKQAESGADLSDAAHLLLDQARIIEGETLPDPAAFAQRMADVMAKSFG